MNNHFNKIFTGTALIASTLEAPAQKEVAPLESPIQSLEMNTGVGELIQAADLYEHKLSLGKEIQQSDRPTRAIFSADDLSGIASFVQNQEYSPNFWSSVLGVTLYEQDQNHAYFEHAPGDIKIIKNEKAITDPATTPTFKHVPIGQYIIVSVDQVHHTVNASICNAGSKTPLGVASAKINPDYQQTLGELTQKILAIQEIVQ